VVLICLVSIGSMVGTAFLINSFFSAINVVIAGLLVVFSLERSYKYIRKPQPNDLNAVLLLDQQKVNFSLNIVKLYGFNSLINFGILVFKIYFIIALNSSTNPPLDLSSNILNDLELFASSKDQRF